MKAIMWVGGALSLGKGSLPWVGVVFFADNKTVI